MLLSLPCTIAAAVLLFAAPLHAQTATGLKGPFVDVRVGSDHDDTRPRYAISGVTRRTGISFGYDWGRSGVELDVTVPEWHTAAYRSTYVFAGPSNALEQHGHTYESIDTVRRRSTDVILLYRVNVPLHQRVALTWLVGCGQVYRPEHSNPILNDVLPDGSRKNVYDLSRTSSRDYVVAVTRLDADVRIAGGLWVGPRLSLTMYPSFLDESGLAPRGFVARPELAIRWRF